MSAQPQARPGRAIVAVPQPDGRTVNVAASVNPGDRSVYFIVTDGDRFALVPYDVVHEVMLTAMGVTG